jgi:hypothetical protein
MFPENFLQPFSAVVTLNILLTSEMRNFYLFIGFLLISTTHFAQSSATASVSANVVTPVGTESMGVIGSENFTITPTKVPARLQAKENTVTEQNHGTERHIHQMASIKLWNNNYAFGVLQIETPVLKNNDEKSSITIEKINTKITRVSEEQLSAIITLDAVVNIKTPEASGFYTGAKPMHVIINFD